MRFSRLLLVACLAVAGCAAPMAPPPAGGALVALKALPALSGRVAFPGRSVLDAGPSAIALNATVSLIALDGTTIGVGLTSGAASAFTVNFVGSPSALVGTLYVLEAVKGLGGGAPGSPAGRLRTLVRFNGTGWDSPTVGGLVINTSTTALAAAAAIRNLTPGTVDLNALMGTLDNTQSFAGVAGLSAGDFTDARGVIEGALDAGRDPVASLALRSGAWQYSQGSATVTGMDRAKGAAGQTVHVYGTGFSPTAADNQVTFNDLPATVVSATSTDLLVEVPTVVAPEGRTSVVVGVNGQVAGGAAFKVLQGAALLSGFTEESARLGAERCYGAIATYGGDVYLIGGSGNPLTPYKTVEKVHIAHDTGRAPGYRAAEVTTLTSQLVQERDGNQAIVIGRRLFVFGGATLNNAPCSIAEYADFDDEGVLGAFTTADTTGANVSAIERTHFACVYLDGAVYLIGGNRWGTPLATVARIPVLDPTSDAPTLDFAHATVTANPLANREDAAIAMAGSRAYMLGGVEKVAGAEVGRDSVTMLTVDGNHDLVFSPLDDMGLSGRAGHMAAVVDDKLYAIGGRSAIGFTQKSQYVSLNADGTLLGTSFEAGNDSNQQDSDWHALVENEGGMAATFGHTVFWFGGLPNGSGLSDGIRKAELDDVRSEFSGMGPL